MKYLHVWNVSSSHSLRCIGCNERLVRIFSAEEHIIYINGPRIEWQIDLEQTLEIHYEDKSASYKEKMETLYHLAEKVDCIVFHSLYDAQSWRLKLWRRIQQNLCIKTIWAVWGHDVYDAYWRAHQGPGKHPFRYLKVCKKEALRREIIKHITCIMAIPGDYQAVKKWYDTKAKYVMFNQVSYGGSQLIELPEKKNDSFNVIIGHDAYPHCRHKETLDILKHYDDGKLQVYCPLPYSGEMPQLVKEVMDYGNSLFPNRFHPLTSELKYGEYCKVVNEMDVALYNHNRQMAEGNVLMYLYYGKKVFVSKENCIGEFFRNLGAEIYSMEDLCHDTLFNTFDTDTKEKNRTIIEYNLSDEAFHKTWKEAFDCVK